MAESSSAPAPAPLRVIAIDGVLGSGKTTVARRLAVDLGLDYLDTGAMYRCVGLACSRAGIALDDGAAAGRVARQARIEVSTNPDGTQLVKLDDVDVTAEIRSPEAARAASTVATHPEVRAAMVAQQRDWAHRRGGGVLEGRDIATAVFPDAPTKIFLTAEVSERARRRHAELGDRPLEEVIADLEWRDRQDSTRAADPLKVADGAMVLDTTGLTIDEVVARIVTAHRAHADTDAELADTDAQAAESTQAVDRAQSATDSALRRASAEPSQQADRRDPDAPVPSGDRGPTTFERALWSVVRFLVFGIVKVYFRPQYRGLENVPASGAYLVAPVHRSNVDTVVLPGLTRRRIRFLGKASMWKFKPVTPLWDALGGIKVDRGTTDRESMKLCMDALTAGEPLVVYPEGRRKEGDRVEDLFEGAAYMAIKAGVPVLPIGIGGSDRAMSKDHKFPRPVRISVVVGRPLNDPPIPTRSPRSAIRALTAEMQTEIQRLYDEARR